MARNLALLCLLAACAHPVLAKPKVDGPVETEEQWLARYRCSTSSADWSADLGSSSCSHVTCNDKRLNWTSPDGGPCASPREAPAELRERWKWTLDCSMGMKVAPIIVGNCQWNCTDAGAAPTGGACELDFGPGEPSAF